VIPALVALVALLALLAWPAQAQDADPFARGMLAANAREFAEAVRLWRPLAEAGDARAAYLVAMTIERGEGLPSADPAEAARYYALAARAGHAEAGNALAVMLVEGRGGLARDPVEAWAWFALAAERGSGFAAPNRDRLGGRLAAEELAEGEARLAALRAGGP
jgi:uncharacterized protein